MYGAKVKIVKIDFFISIHKFSFTNYFLLKYIFPK